MRCNVDETDPIADKSKNLELSGHTDKNHNSFLFEELLEALEELHSTSVSENEEGFEKAFESAFHILNDNDTNPIIIRDCIKQVNLMVGIRESFETFYFVRFMKLFLAISKVKDAAQLVEPEFITELIEFTQASITDREAIETICAAIREIISTINVNPTAVVGFSLTTLGAYKNYTPIESSCLEIISKLVRLDLPGEMLEQCYECALSYINVITVSSSGMSSMAVDSYKILRGCFECDSSFCERIYEEGFDDVFDPSFSPYSPQLYTLATWFDYVHNKEMSIEAVSVRLRWEELMTPAFGTEDLPSAIAALHLSVTRILPDFAYIFDECGAWDTVVTIANEDADFASRSAAVDAIAGAYQRISRSQFERILRCNFALPVCEVIGSEPTVERVKLLIEVMRVAASTMKKRDAAAICDTIEEEGVEEAIDDDESLESSIADLFIEELRKLREYVEA